MGLQSRAQEHLKYFQKWSENFLRSFYLSRSIANRSVGAHNTDQKQSPHLVVNLPKALKKRLHIAVKVFTPSFLTQIAGNTLINHSHNDLRKYWLPCDLEAQERHCCIYGRRGFLWIRLWRELRKVFPGMWWFSRRKLRTVVQSDTLNWRRSQRQTPSVKGKSRVRKVFSSKMHL